MPYLMLWTEPSPNTAFIPAGWFDPKRNIARQVLPPTKAGSLVFRLRDGFGGKQGSQPWPLPDWGAAPRIVSTHWPPTIPYRSLSQPPPWAKSRNVNFSPIIKVLEVPSVMLANVCLPTRREVMTPFCPSFPHQPKAALPLSVQSCPLSPR